MPAHRYVEENGSAAILAAKRSAGVVSEVNLREHITHMPPPSVNKAAHSNLFQVDYGIFLFKNHLKGKFVNFGKIAGEHNFVAEKSLCQELWTLYPVTAHLRNEIA